MGWGRGGGGGCCKWGDGSQLGCPPVDLHLNCQDMTLLLIITAQLASMFRLHSLNLRQLEQGGGREGGAQNS